MFSFSKIAAFLLVNLSGFLSAPLCYVIGLKTGAIDPSNPGFDAMAFKTWFLTGTIMTWFVCAIFSFAYFFLPGKMRLFFLWMPLVIPIAYGLSSLY